LLPLHETFKDFDKIVFVDKNAEKGYMYRKVPENELSFYKDAKKYLHPTIDTQGNFSYHEIWEIEFTNKTEQDIYKNNSLITAQSAYSETNFDAAKSIFIDFIVDELKKHTAKRVEKEQPLETKKQPNDPTPPTPATAVVKAYPPIPPHASTLAIPLASSGGD
jgi:hypothetical protein